MPKEQNNRKKSRLTLQIVVEYERGKRKDFNFCSDFSKGGIFIETNTPMKIGSVIKLTIELQPHPEILSLQGVIRWVRDDTSDKQKPQGMGVEFLDVTPDQEQIIENQLKYYERIITNFHK